jgi:hypothetical protein
MTQAKCDRKRPSRRRLERYSKVGTGCMAGPQFKVTVRNQIATRCDPREGETGSATGQPQKRLGIVNFDVSRLQANNARMTKGVETCQPRFLSFNDQHSTPILLTFSTLVLWSSSSISVAILCTMSSFATSFWSVDYAAGS